jgi:hypothetical protein
VSDKAGPKWVRFVVTTLKGRSTEAWRVESREDRVELGYIKFYPRWRKFAFFPLNDTLYEADCLHDIADFCKERTREFLTAKRRRAAQRTPEGGK